MIVKSFKYPYNINDGIVKYKVSNGIKNIPLLRPEALALLISVVEKSRVYEGDKINLFSALTLGDGSDERATGFRFILEYRNYNIENIMRMLKDFKEGINNQASGSTDFFSYGKVHKDRSNSSHFFIEFRVSPPDRETLTSIRSSAPGSRLLQDHLESSGKQFLWPTPGSYHILSVFGDDRDGGARKHKGVDIWHEDGAEATIGADIVAARGGEVIKSDSGRGGFGKVVAIAHHDINKVTYYAHNLEDSHRVSKGDTVKMGDKIAEMGHTGVASSAYPHIHFEIAVGTTNYFEGQRNRQVDPMGYLDPKFCKEKIDLNKITSGTSRREAYQDPSTQSRPSKSEIDRWDTIELTAYAPLDPKAVEGMCFSGDPTVTASGATSTPGFSCAAGRSILFGTQVWIEGYPSNRPNGAWVVHDRGGMITDQHIDIMIESRDEAYRIGRQSGTRVAWLKERVDL